MNKFQRILLLCLLIWAVALVAQAQSTIANEQAAATDRKSADSETLIPRDSKVFIAPMEGFETFSGRWRAHRVQSALPLPTAVNSWRGEPLLPHESKHFIGFPFLETRSI